MSLLERVRENTNPPRPPTLPATHQPSTTPASQQSEQQQRPAAVTPEVPRMPTPTLVRPTPVIRRPTMPVVTTHPAMNQQGLHSATAYNHPRYQEIINSTREYLLGQFSNLNDADGEEAKRRLAEAVPEVCAGLGISLTRHDQSRLVERLQRDILGLGPLDLLLELPDVTEIMINGPKKIFIEQHGKLEKFNMEFASNEHLLQIIDKIVTGVGRRIDESSPMVDARLKDGSRVNVIIPPLSLIGPTITIRRFSKDPYTIDSLIKFGTITEEMATFLRACVRARQNIVVAGGTGSGKTTTLNVLSSWIPEDERIVTIEGSAELQLNQEHVVPLESRPANMEGRGRIGIRDLVINALRMRPDRIVVGEVRGGEALDMLQAMNTGHDGSLTTVHANSPQDVISRLETMVLMAGTDLPSRAIREQITSAVNIITQQARLRDGSRRMVAISEVRGFDGVNVELAEIFAFRQTGVDAQGKVIGHFEAVNEPKCLEDLRSMGEDIDPGIFSRRQ